MRFQESIDSSALPQPPAEALRYSALLAQHMRGLIAARGSIPFADFMRTALYEPGLGYYMTGLRKFGADGDFITAPEISPLFSFCLAEQYCEVRQQLPEASILEIGAGSGVMAADILQYLAGHACLPRHYFILELSAELQQRQRETLQARVPEMAGRVRWLSTLDNFRFQGMVLANEVLDAMPVHRFLCHDKGVQEMRVGIDPLAEDFGWMFKPADTELRRALDTVWQDLGHELPAGYTSELNLNLQPWFDGVWRCITDGVVLLIDYGYPRSEYYLPERTMGTLSCHYRHRMHDNPFILIGLQDITAFVDFSAVAQAAEAVGFELGGFIDQAGFLLNCGIEKLCAQRLSAATKIDQQLQLTQQVKTLLLPSEMGERFKVLALHKAYNRPLMGFGAIDQRHRL
jgi:SAM-dependent MidA family methyltransferase